MSFWQEKILPAMIDRGMRNDIMARQRSRAAPLAIGRVLEIGMGSGLNLPLYNEQQVQHIFGLEPSAALREKAVEMLGSIDIPIDFIAAGAEPIPLDTHSVDTVVSSWTLCSIPDIEMGLQEIRRVLKPDGRFVFIEHGRAPDKAVAKWQRRLRPISRPLLGCDLSQPMDQLIRDAGFDFPALETAYLQGPKLISYHYIGQAKPI